MTHRVHLRTSLILECSKSGGTEIASCCSKTTTLSWYSIQRLGKILSSPEFSNNLEYLFSLTMAGSLSSPMAVKPAGTLEKPPS